MCNFWENLLRIWFFKGCYNAWFVPPQFVEHCPLSERHLLYVMSQGFDLFPPPFDSLGSKFDPASIFYIIINKNGEVSVLIMTIWHLKISVEPTSEMLFMLNISQTFVFTTYCAPYWIWLVADLGNIMCTVGLTGCKTIWTCRQISQIFISTLSPSSGLLWIQRQLSVC
jgi:hypothetical protein